MIQKRTVLFALVIAAAIAGLFIIMAAFFIGDRHAVETMHFTSTDPTTLAEAMKQDHFYSDYRESTLLMTGMVNWVNQQPHSTIVRFLTHSTYVTRCTLDSTSRVPAINEPVRVLAEGGTAARQPDGVLLTNCIVL